MGAKWKCLSLVAVFFEGGAAVVLMGDGFGEAEAFFFSFGTLGCCSLGAVAEVLARHFGLLPPCWWGV